MAIAHHPSPAPVSLASENQRGIGLVLLGMASFTVGDAFIKTMSDTVPLGQIIALRGVLSLAFVLPLLLVREGLPQWSKLADWRVGLRSLLEVGATICFVQAITSMEFASAIAVLQATPLAVTFFGSLLLGEKVGWRRYGAILAGFAGVLVIVRPGAEAFDSASIYALATVGFATGRDLLTRRMPSSISSLQVVAVTLVAVTLLGLGWMAMDGAVSLSGWNAFGLVVAAAALPIGYMCVTSAVRIGELAVVTPFRYSIFLWALLLGYLVFDEVPDAMTMAGTLIVLGSGLYTLLREAKLNRDIAARSGKRGTPV